MPLKIRPDDKKLKLKKDGTPSKQGQGGGKPPIFPDELTLKKAIDAYFNDCIKKGEIPNKAGFRLFTGLSKDTIEDYRVKYPEAIKGAEDKIENAWVQRLKETAATGAIFYLKNAFWHDYKEKNETDITSKGQKIVGIKYIIPTNGNNNITNNKTTSGVGDS